MANEKYLTLTEESFERDVLAADRPVLVDFWADWCAPCRAVGPVVERLAEEHEGVAVVGKVDVDSEAGLARRYDVRSIPTLLFFRNGEVVDRMVGAGSPRQIEEKLKSLL